ncbi:2,3-diketo-L-gulonate reductase [Drosophila albomicans]|uniref:2,3-diketo-L-gulonate reductase n=1 Tax=Drosophila albomicans TaxID=7291 RepID=A0A9C6TC82_DROAB|nr:2,3-diketo-L-gulonate reductase [Drosophila albomicans]
MRRLLNMLERLRKVHVKPKLGSQLKSDHKEPINKNYKKDIKMTNDTKPLDNKVIWQNLQHVLRVCEGHEQPPIRGQVQLDMASDVDSLADVLDIQRFVSDVFAAMNVPLEAASEMADALIAADYMGERSMGIHRLPAIANDLLNLRVDPRMRPKVLCEREALALVDGQNAPGPVVANFCMDLAMSKAREQTIGLVVSRCSNNIGMASWYACQALSQRLLGVCMSSGLPVLVASGGKEPLLGANSISCAAATGTQQQFVMNVGMPGYTIEQLELDYCNGYTQQLPPHLALDCNGLATSNVADALQAQRLLPFAPEYKGFGLAAMVETLCGVMTGARYASQVVGRQGLFGTDQDVADLGQVYIAIDPMRFCVSFEERLSDFQQLLRDALPWDANQTPLIPGDKESLHMQMVDDQGGLTLSPCTLYVLQELSERFNIKPLVVQKTE